MIFHPGINDEENMETARLVVVTLPCIINYSYGILYIHIYLYEWLFIESIDCWNSKYDDDGDYYYYHFVGDDERPADIKDIHIYMHMIEYT